MAMLSHFRSPDKLSGRSRPNVTLRHDFRLSLRKTAGPLGKALLRILYACRRPMGARAEAAILKLVNPDHDRFLPPDLSPEEFFRRLDERQVHYVVLRWFEELPKLARKHDLDLLASDETVAALRAELTMWPLGHPVDVYSVSGLPGTAYQLIDADNPARVSIPVLPPQVAGGVLERRIRFNDLCFVPCPSDHFCALAYHITYLKAVGLGLPVHHHCPEVLSSASHDYPAHLMQLADRAGISIPAAISRDSLDDLLAELRWQPPVEQLRTIAASVSWLQRKYFNERQSEAV